MKMCWSRASKYSESIDIFWGECYNEKALLCNNEREKEKKHEERF